MWCSWGCSHGYLCLGHGLVSITILVPASLVAWIMFWFSCARDVGLCLSMVGMLVGFDNCSVCGAWLLSSLLASLPVSNSLYWLVVLFFVCWGIALFGNKFLIIQKKKKKKKDDMLICNHNFVQ